MKHFIFLVFLLFGLISRAQLNSKSRHFEKKVHTFNRPEIVDTSFAFLWFAEEKFGTATSVKMIIDTVLAKRLHPGIKACIAYTSYDLCTECQWGDNHELGTRNDLICLLNEALELGPQSSEFQQAFLRSWFRNDSLALEQISSCGTIPNTSTILNMPNSINVEVEEDFVIVRCNVSGYNFREQKYWEYSRKNTFKLTYYGIQVEDLYSSNVKIDYFKWEDEL